MSSPFYPLFDPHGPYMNVVRYITDDDGGASTIRREFSFIRKNVLDMLWEQDPSKPQPWTEDDELDQQIHDMRLQDRDNALVQRPQTPKPIDRLDHAQYMSISPPKAAPVSKAWGGLLKIDTSEQNFSFESVQWDHNSNRFTNSGFKNDPDKIPELEGKDHFRVSIGEWSPEDGQREGLFFLLRQIHLHELKAYLSLTEEDYENPDQSVANVVTERVRIMQSDNSVSSDAKALTVIQQLQESLGQYHANDNLTRRQRELLRVIGTIPQLRSNMTTQMYNLKQCTRFEFHVDLGRQYPNLGEDGMPFWGVFILGPKVST